MKIMGLILGFSLAASPILAQTQDFKVDSTHTFSDGRTIKYLHDGRTAESSREDSVVQVTDTESQSVPLHPKNEALAYGLALGGTLIPSIIGINMMITVNDKGGSYAPGIILTTFGGIIGPSLGEFYAGSYGLGAVGIIGRLLGAGMIVAHPSGSAGAIIFVSATIFSLIETDFAVERVNKKVKAQHIGFSPELFPSSSGKLQPGMMAWARF